MSNSTSNPAIASTILEQLGGSRFLAMTGTKNLLDLGQGLSGKVGKNSSRVTHFRIELRADDTYDVTFLRCWGTKAPVEISKTEGAYDDMLRPLFEKATGMYTSL